MWFTTDEERREKLENAEKILKSRRELNALYESTNQNSQLKKILALIAVLILAVGWYLTLK